MSEFVSNWNSMIFNNALILIANFNFTLFEYYPVKTYYIITTFILTILYVEKCYPMMSAHEHIAIDSTAYTIYWQRVSSCLLVIIIVAYVFIAFATECWRRVFSYALQIWLTANLYKQHDSTPLLVLRHCNITVK